jgi:hypothetical protein
MKTTLVAATKTATRMVMTIMKLIFFTYSSAKQ